MKNVIRIDPCVVCHVHLDDNFTCYNLNYKITSVSEYYNYLDQLRKMALDISTNYFQHKGYIVSFTYHILSYNTQHVVIGSKVGQFYNLLSHNNLKKEIKKHQDLVHDYIFEVRE